MLDEIQIKLILAELDITFRYFYKRAREYADIEQLSKAFIEQAKEILKPDESEVTDCITISWATEDVLSVRPDLTEEQASHILKLLKKGHDANFGISWDTIDTICDIEYPL